MYKRLLVTAACIYLAFAACNSNANLVNLQAGAATFSVQEQNLQITNTMFDYNFKSTFSANPNVALALQGFEIKSPNITEWVIAPGSVTTAKMSIQFTQQPTYWTSAYVRFIASARPDITVGSKLATFSAIKDSVATVTVNLNTKIANFDTDTISKVYATGYRRVSGTSMDVTVSGRSMTDSTLTFNIQTGSNLQINYVQINYIIFNPKKVNFASYGGSITKQNFSGSLVQNIQREVHDPRYAFYGLVAIKITQSGAYTFKLNLIDPFYVRIDSNRAIDQLSTYFVILGVPPKFVCTQCSDKSDQFIYQSQCLAVCPTNSYPVNYQDGATGCRKCPVELNMIVNVAKNGCICKIGYSIKNGICEQDRQNSLFNFSSVQPSNTGFAQIPSTTNAQNTSTTNSQNQNQNLIPNKIATNQSFSPQASQQSTPQIASNSIRAQTTSTNIAQSIQYKAQDCNLANSYWTGYRCTCKPGYSSINGLCANSGIGNPGAKIFRPAQFIYSISYLYTNQKPITCDKANEIYDGQSCVCAPGYSKDSIGYCSSNNDLTCPINSKPVNKVCVCDFGYVKKDGYCVKPNNSCPTNSNYNGVQCVCDTGYFMNATNQCVLGKVCPPYSNRVNGECICLSGYRLTLGACIRCPENQVYIASQDICVFTCGVNQQINIGSQSCECKPGYGKYDGICNICPNNFFNNNGYCVVCPLQSIYNQQNKKCDCSSGSILHSSGYCQGKCDSINEIYNSILNTCRCLNGLARINGKCEVCTNGFIDPITQQCLAGCSLNQVLSGSKCICKVGFGLNRAGKCASCEQTGQFLIDGNCATCPTGKIYINNTCQCPNGKQVKDNVCVDSCQSGQLIDNNGNCYWCPLNENIVNGKCSCKQGYVRNGFFCQQQCKVNQYVINGLCGMCALNTVYSPDVKACICPQKFYMNNYGVCEQIILPPIDCPQGKYYSPTDGCLVCPFGCSACLNVKTCTKCTQVGFIPQGGKCVPNCGDGSLSAGEACDDGNRVSGDGCSSSCQRQKDYECTGSPSICRPLAAFCSDGFISPSEQCDDANKNNGDGCSSNCLIEPGFKCDGIPSRCIGTTITNKGMKQESVMMNEGNVYVTLKTDKQYFFSSDLEMKTFMQYSFPNPKTEPASAYCVQDSSQPQLFRCLIIYPYGVPNFKYDINFSFNFKGDQGAVVVPVDPMKNSFASRSLH